MTNTEIITRSAVLAGLYTKEEAEAILKSCRVLPLHTYSAWKQAGFQVKRGEKAVLTVCLWKFRAGRKTGEVAEVPGMLNADGSPATVEKQEADKQFRTTAYLFSDKQVEKIKPVHVKTPEEIKAYNAKLAAERKARKAAQQAPQAVAISPAVVPAMVAAAPDEVAASVLF